MIGDNPNGDGEVVLRIIAGMIVSATGVAEEFDVPDDYDGEYSDRDFVLTEEDLDHVQDRQGHLSRQ